MSATAASDRGAAAAASRPAPPGRPTSRPSMRALRVAFVGAPALLDAHAPSAPHDALAYERFAVFPASDAPRRADASAARASAEADPAAPRADLAAPRADLAATRAFEPDVTVVFDPQSLAPSLLDGLPGVTLGVLTSGLPSADRPGAAAAMDRLVSFDPALTGAKVAGARAGGVMAGRSNVWRAVPPPVGDALFAPARALHSTPRAMSLGRSTAHRETMLMPAKHHHDLLQVCHGVSGAPLAQLCREHDVGVYIAREWGGGFGWQVAMHLAAGHLLLAETLRPAHGLERNIDYLQIDSAEGLVHRLDRLARFPEMSRSLCVRGRRKAEQFRASSLFARLTHDLLLDVAAFGRRDGAGSRRRRGAAPARRAGL